MSRERFNLDSIAGNGDDISRIKNLLYWVHNNISHDGSNGLAPGGRNLRNTYDSALRDSCGYNCRALAICLCGGFACRRHSGKIHNLSAKSMGHRQRLPCHLRGMERVFRQMDLGRSYICRLRYRRERSDVTSGRSEIQAANDMPLILNEDANWNNIRTETKEDYLDYYMAKNLYIIEANTLNQAEPEGESSHKQGFHVAPCPARHNLSLLQLQHHRRGVVLAVTRA